MASLRWFSSSPPPRSTLAEHAVLHAKYAALRAEREVARAEREVARAEREAIQAEREVFCTERAAFHAERKVVNAARAADSKVYSVRWMQPIFLPLTTYLPNHQRVLDRFLEYAQRHRQPLQVTVYLAGWARTDELWNQYYQHWQSVRDQLPPDSGWTLQEPVRFPYNYGQAYVYHHFFEAWKREATAPREGETPAPDNSVIATPCDSVTAAPCDRVNAAPCDSANMAPCDRVNAAPCDYVVTNGSDLCFLPGSPAVLHHMLSALAHVDRVGYAAFNLSPDNVHQHSVNASTDLWVQVGHPSSDLVQDNPKIWFSDCGGGVAGAIAVIPWHILLEVNGYPVRGVFSPEDGQFFEAVRCRGYRTLIANNLCVLHEFGPTVAYPAFMDWKRRSFNFALAQAAHFVGEEALRPWAEESAQIFAEIEH